MPLTILSPGPLTTVQDEGRFGHLHAGIGRSGAMDARAYRAARERSPSCRARSPAKQSLIDAILSPGLITRKTEYTEETERKRRGGSIL